MANHRDEAALFLIQPWTNMRCDEDRYTELVKFARELKSRGIPIIYETYSSYFIEELYDLANIRVIYRVRDANEIMEYLIDEAREEDQHADENESEKMPIWDPKTDIEESEDYDKSWNFDPDEEASRYVGSPPGEGKMGDFHTWRIVNSGFNIHGMPDSTCNMIKSDVKESEKIKLTKGPKRPRKTRVFELDERTTGATEYILECLKELDPKINYFMITGGYPLDCVDERLGNLREYKNHLRILARYIAVRTGSTLDDWYKTRPTGFRRSKGSEKIITDSTRKILRYL